MAFKVFSGSPEVYAINCLYRALSRWFEKYKILRFYGFGLDQEVACLSVS